MVTALIQSMREFCLHPGGPKSSLSSKVSLLNDFLYIYSKVSLFGVSILLHSAYSKGCTVLVGSESGFKVFGWLIVSLNGPHFQGGV